MTDLELLMTEKLATLTHGWVQSGRCRSEEEAYAIAMELSNLLIKGATFTVDENRVVRMRKADDPIR